MKNRIIVFANQKGGVGKSTLCILFANYLAYKRKPVCIIDTDLQKTIMMQRRKDEKVFEGQDEPYSIQDFDVSDPDTMQQLMDSARQVMYLRTDSFRCSRMLISSSARMSMRIKPSILPAPSFRLSTHFVRPTPI